MGTTDNEIELPEIEEAIDLNEQLLQQALEAGTAPAPGEDLTIAEIDLINSGEASPELLAKLESSLVGPGESTKVEETSIAASTTAPTDEDDSSAVNNDTDNMQSVISEQSLPPEPPAARDFATELAGIQASHADLAGQLKELIKAVEDGDKLESDVLDERLAIEAKLQALATDRRLVEREHESHQREVEQYQQRRDQYQQNWQKTCTDFVTVHNKDFYIADGKPNQERLADLDAMLRSTAATNPGMSDAKVLEIAHQKVLKLAGAAPAAEQKSAKPADAKKPVQIPPVLGGLPSAEGADANSRWGKLNNARGDDLVEAVAGMTEAQLQAWLISN